MVNKFEYPYIRPNQSWVVKLLKPIIAILLFYCIYITLNGYKNELVWPSLSKNKIHYVFFVLILMPLNWFIESRRWQMVMQYIGKPVSLKKSIESTIAGLTLSMITPFKLGDYAGRMLLLRSEYKKSSLYATLLCSIYQNVVNLSFGIIAMYFLIQLNNHFEEHMWPFVILNTVVVVMALFVMLKVDVIIGHIGSIPWVNEKLSVDRNSELDVVSKLRLMLLSILRYSIYITQYLLILYFLNVENSILELIGGISAIYLIQSTIPLPPFLSFLARTEIAILVWKIIGLHLSVALAATVMLWVINLMLPALLGLVLILYKWR